MNKSNLIRRAVRKMLLERKNGTFSYGCVMANLKITQDEWDDILSLIEDDELYTEEKGFGKEDDPHVTILYGLHQSVEDDEVKEKVEEFKPFEIKLDKVDIFDTNEKFDVVKFSITNSQLHDYNDSLKELPYTNDYPDYKPHVTLAYVKKGKGKEIMERYKDFDELIFTCDTIRYSKADKTNKYYKLNKDE